MRTILLKRKMRIGNAVNGTIAFPVKFREGDIRTLEYPCIENSDFIIPAGTYPVKETWSPKFKKLLPILEDVPDRDGIRIHMGSKPEHSKGCILTNMGGMCNLHVMFNQIEDDDEKVQIEIIEEFTA